MRVFRGFVRLLCITAMGVLLLAIQCALTCVVLILGFYRKDEIMAYAPDAGSRSALAVQLVLIPCLVVVHEVAIHKLASRRNIMEWCLVLNSCKAVLMPLIVFGGPVAWLLFIVPSAYAMMLRMTSASPVWVDRQ